MSAAETGGRGDAGPELTTIPKAVRQVLPADTAEAWVALAPHLPASLCLGGGTAVAVHLGHRVSRNLDFFFHDGSAQIAQLRKLIGSLGDLAITYEDEETLKGLFGKTKIEIFDAGKLKLLRKPCLVAGLHVARLEDLLAMKLKVMAERGEMRDYFDVKEIDERSSLSIEEGIELFAGRYHVDLTDQAQLLPLYLSMGNLEDVEEDEALPITKAELSKWWSRRQVEVLRKSSWFS